MMATPNCVLDLAAIPQRTHCGKIPLFNVVGEGLLLGEKPMCEACGERIERQNREMIALAFKLGIIDEVTP